MSGQPYITTPSGRRIRIGDKKNGMLLRKHPPLYTVTFVSNCEWAAPEVNSIQVIEGGSAVVGIIYNHSADYTCVTASGATISESGILVANVSSNMTIYLRPAKVQIIPVIDTDRVVNISPSVAYAYQGDTATFTVTYAEGYEDSDVDVQYGTISGNTMTITALYNDWYMEPGVTNHIPMYPINVDVSIGDINTSDTFENLPTYSYYEYSITEQILYPSDIMYDGQTRSGTINSISFFVNQGYYPQKTRELYIYMAHTMQTQFSGSKSWIPMNQQNLVYHGEVNIDSAVNDWLTLELDTPFIYDGNQNLVIMVDDNTGEWWSASSFAVQETSSPRGIYTYRDEVDFLPDSTSHPDTDTVNLVNCMKLGMTIMVPDRPPADIIIGDNNYLLSRVPVNTGYRYSLTEQIYLPSEINTAGYIRTMGFNISTAYAQTRTVDIYMARISRNSFPNETTDIIPLDEAHNVFSGSIDCSQRGWIELALDKPFYYDGISNLLIMVNDTTGYGNSSSVTWYSYQSKNDNHRCINYQNNNEAYDPSNPTAFSTVQKYPEWYNNQLHLIIDEVDPMDVPTEDKVVVVPIGGYMNNTESLPSYSYYKYSISQQLYLSSEIGQSGFITDFSITVKEASPNAIRQISVYMALTDRSVVGGTGTEESWSEFKTATLVYTGELDASTIGLKTFKLATPFEFDSNYNLLLFVCDNTGSDIRTTRPAYSWFNSGSSRALYNGSLTGGYYPDKPVVSNSYVKGSSNSINSVIFTISPELIEPDSPTTVNGG